jgi:lsr operon transcriptional repressor
MAHDADGTPAPDDEQLLGRVAWYYHHDGLTQDEVGRRLGLSRIKVSRLLDRAKRAGVIGITIHSTNRDCLALEGRLRERHGLTEAIVIPALPPPSGGHETPHATNERLTQAAASYLMNFISDGSVLAVGWGDTVTRTLKRLGHLLGHTGASVVTLTGGVSTYLQMMGGLSAPIAQAQRLHMIPSPLITSRAATARALLEEPAVQEVIAMARRADCALIGIGALEEDASLVRGGYLSNEELAAYRAMGAVGDILGRFLDHRGHLLDLEIHDRIVGIDLQSLSAIARVIGVAGGAHKVEAIRAVLAGGTLDMLITDEPTARALVD